VANDRYLVLARKWRPQKFEDVVGQEHITRTLRNAITSGRIHHAFLFIGSRGIGKTTTARILAMSLNCLSSENPTPDPCCECENCTSIIAGNNIDVIEIDGASNNGVDDVREIRDNIRMVPTHGRYKVYIIDEVHQLSISAFNALLKTLEEPPSHAIFILATTEAHKIPATIVSRCQRYDFRRVAIPRLIELLRTILESEGIAATDEALHAISRAAEGGVRDAESILDELITYCDKEITFQDVTDVLGLVDWDVLHKLGNAILQKDIAGMLTLVEQVIAGGKDLSQFVQEILRYYRNLLVLKTADGSDIVHLPEEELAALREQAQQYSLTNLIRLVEQFAELSSGFDSQLAQRIALEAMLIRISKVGVDRSVDGVLEKLAALSEGGLPPAAQAPAAPDAPPGPKPAGVAPKAPAAPAPKKKRAAVTADNLDRAWKYITEYATENGGLNVGIWSGLAHPTGVEDQTLILTFSSENAQAREIIERHDTRAMLEGALSEVTTNITTFRTRVEEAPAQQAPTTEEPLQTGGAFYGAVDPERAKRAMEDENVALVLDVFKARIAKIEGEADTPPADD
jgi:DNA polymerase-3 subunit gamma/tau